MTAHESGTEYSCRPFGTHVRFPLSRGISCRAITFAASRLDSGGVRSTVFPEIQFSHLLTRAGGPLTAGIAEVEAGEGPRLPRDGRAYVPEGEGFAALGRTMYRRLDNAAVRG